MMKLRSRYPFALVLLALSLVAASPVPTESPPVFLTKWRTNGSGDGQFKHPEGVAVDDLGNIHVVDILNRRMQKFGGPWLEFFTGELETPSDR